MRYSWYREGNKVTVIEVYENEEALLSHCNNWMVSEYAPDMLAKFQFDTIDIYAPLAN